MPPVLVDTPYCIRWLKSQKSVAAFNKPRRDQVAGVRDLYLLVTPRYHKGYRSGLQVSLVPGPPVRAGAFNPSVGLQDLRHSLRARRDCVIKLAATFLRHKFTIHNFIL